MRLAVLAFATLAVVAHAPARAGTLERVRAAGTLACGVPTEPSDYNHADPHGPLPEFGADLCRAVAAAVFGDAGKLLLVSLPDEADGFDALAAGKIDVLMSATPSLPVARARGIAFGHPVFLDGEGILVPTGHGIASLEDLAGRTLCFIPSQAGHEALLAGLARRKIAVSPFPFEEIGEMEAAFVGRRCDAMAGPLSQLAESRSAFGAAQGRYTLLPDRLTLDPLAPAVLAADPAWRDVVDYAVSALIEAEGAGITQASVAETGPSDDPVIRRLLGADPLIAHALGLADDFGARAIAAVGNYGEVYDRDVGAHSDLRIPRGPNAPAAAGGALLGAPFR